MITVVVVAVLVIVLVTLRYTGRGRARSSGRRGLKRRFGPEYESAVARQNGDARAAERELCERVRRHGSLQEQPLSPEVREQYVAQWDAVQERFVGSPQGRHRGGCAVGAPGEGSWFPGRRAVRGAAGCPLRPPRLLRSGLPQHARGSPRPERHRGNAGGHGRSPRPLRGTCRRTTGRPGPAPPAVPRRPGPRAVATDDPPSCEGKQHLMSHNTEHAPRAQQLDQWTRRSQS